MGKRVKSEFVPRRQFEVAQAATARKGREVHQFAGRLEDTEAELGQVRAGLEEAVRQLLAAEATTPGDLLDECMANARRSPTGRDWTDATVESLSRIHDISPAAYAETTRVFHRLHLPPGETLVRRSKPLRDQVKGILNDVGRIPELLGLWKEKYERAGIDFAEAIGRGCNLAVDATSTWKDGMARKGQRNHGLIVFLVLPRDRRLLPFAIHLIETDDSKLTPAVQKVGKTIARILGENGCPTIYDCSDADPCTASPHRIFHAVRDAVRELLAQRYPVADRDLAPIIGVTLDDTRAFLHMMGMFNGHGLVVADFVHWLRGSVTRLLDPGHVVKISANGPAITQETIRAQVPGALVVDVFDASAFPSKFQDAPALLLFGALNCALARTYFPDYGRFLLPGTLLQLVMRCEFISRATKRTMLEMSNATVQRAIADRHDGGRLADRIEPSGRALARASKDQLVREETIEIAMAEYLAEFDDVENDVGDLDASRVGTKLLEQEFSRIRRTLNNNDANALVQGKVARNVAHDLRAPAKELKEKDPRRHSPVGGGIIRREPCTLTIGQNARSLTRGGLTMIPAGVTFTVDDPEPPVVLVDLDQIMTRQYDVIADREAEIGKPWDEVEAETNGNRHRRRWTTDEDSMLRRLVGEGADLRTIAETLRRTPGAVTSHCRLIGLRAPRADAPHASESEPSDAEVDVPDDGDRMPRERLARPRRRTALPRPLAEPPDDDEGFFPDELRPRPRRGDPPRQRPARRQA